MPSRDPKTGRRLGNAAQQKLKRARQAAGLTPADGPATLYPIHTELHNVPAPPSDPSVAAVEAWCAGLNLRAAVALETADDDTAPRLAAIVGIVRECGKLKDKAGRAEKALQLRRLRLGEDVVLDPASPPYDDASLIPLWAFLRLAALAHDAATSPQWQPDGRLAAVKALAAAGFLPCNAELRRVADVVKAT